MKREKARKLLDQCIDEMIELAKQMTEAQNMKEHLVSVEYKKTLITDIRQQMYKLRMKTLSIIDAIDVW